MSSNNIYLVKGDEIINGHDRNAIVLNNFFIDAITNLTIRRVQWD